jgi:hypothetical protein
MEAAVHLLMQPGTLSPVSGLSWILFDCLDGATATVIRRSVCISALSTTDTPASTKLLQAELLGFPFGKHDDHCDALALIGQILDVMTPRSGPPPPLPGLKVISTDSSFNAQSLWKICGRMRRVAVAILIEGSDELDYAGSGVEHW